MRKTNVTLYIVAAVCWLGAAAFVIKANNIKMGILYLVLAAMNFVLAYVSNKKLGASENKTKLRK
ncbi:hypothetical protein ABG79_00738 [Caloramator mitchellensis]|uniref:Uncharacterized protein n=1 Tax=Caloramator mitchellensis TaxID=908809 RepID=A0A0R3JV45_CALMK|nr:hypothetical protein [Caloramator mitchellensis]KRQ87400.1 hypothetical protein ABG79_00738 [Caloramator mitchellensis]